MTSLVLRMTLHVYKIDVGVTSQDLERRHCNVAVNWILIIRRVGKQACCVLKEEW